jgi:hypothetical protein
MLFREGVGFVGFTVTLRKGRNDIKSWQDSFGGGSGRRKAATYTGEHKHRKNAEKHPCLEWDSKTRPQCSRGRRRFLPYTARPLWSASFVLTSCNLQAHLPVNIVRCNSGYSYALSKHNFWFAPSFSILIRRYSSAPAFPKTGRKSKNLNWLNYNTWCTRLLSWSSRLMPLFNVSTPITL